MYKVIKFFRDLQDNNHAYHVGDTYPHGGMAASKKRIQELATDANRRHEPLIEEVKEDFMNPPEESQELPKESKPKKKRGRPRNDAK